MAEPIVWHQGVVVPSSSLTVEIRLAILAALTDAQIVGLTAWAEARSRLDPTRGWVSNPLDAMIDIIDVVRNRTRDKRWVALGPRGVCLQRWAFSCWEPTGGADSNKDPLHLADNFEQLFDRAQRLAAGEVSAKLDACVGAATTRLGLDTLVGVAIQNATHYYAPLSMVPKGRVPKWVNGATFTAERFGHKFYANVR